MSSSLLRKCRNRVTSLTPAAWAMRRAVAPRTPDSANVVMAASSSAVLTSTAIYLTVAPAPQASNYLLTLGAPAGRTEDWTEGGARRFQVYDACVQLRLPWAPSAPRAHTVVAGGRVFPVEAVRRRRARRYILRVTTAGTVRLTVPRGG